MIYDIPLEAWREVNEEANDEAPCDLCLDTYGETWIEVDGIPVLVCEDCEDSTSRDRRVAAIDCDPGGAFEAFRTDDPSGDC